MTWKSASRNQGCNPIWEIRRNNHVSQRQDVETTERFKAAHTPCSCQYSYIATEKKANQKL